MRTLLSKAFVALLCAASSAYAAPDRAGDFALLDTSGEFHQLSRYRHKEALVLMAFDANCAEMPAAINELEARNEVWQEQDVAFALINASANQDLDKLREQRAGLGIDLPVLIDKGQLVSETMDLRHAGEVVVLDPERLSLLYRGPVSADLDSTLEAELDGNDAATRLSPASGCEVRYPGREVHADAAPDYASEVAPIIAEQCASCHREGGIGPFAMDSHLMLQGWSPMIREVLLTKRMPPMQVDPFIGHFENANYLSEKELQTLVHWIDAGAPRGIIATDPLAELEFPDRRSWVLGEPDYIIKAPTHEIPATGVLDYVNVDVDLPFEEDKWVKSVQFIAGDESVLHHLLTYVTAPAEDFDGGESDTRSIARRFLEGYAPGKMDPMTFPENTGVLIPKGHKLSMQFHYTTNGRQTVDETLLGLYMYEEPPEHENFTRSVASVFRIPPYAREHEAAARYTFDEDVIVTGLRAHMNFRGKDMKFRAVYPDGTAAELLSVPSYSYAWQPTYQLTQPALLPAGTTVHVTGTFDNSEHNPANPDPSKEITFGLQSWDEMFIGYWTYHVAD